MTSSTGPNNPFLAELGGTGMADLGVLALGRPDRSERDAVLDRVRVAAAEAPSRIEDVERSRANIAELMLVRLNRAGFVVTWAGLPWAGMSSLRVEDRVWLTIAAQDAAIADLLADRLSPADRDDLRGPWEVAASMPGLGYDGVVMLEGRRGIVAAVALVAVSLITGSLPFLVVLALQGRRRRRLADAPG